MKEFYTTAEVAKTLGVPVDRVKQWRARGTIRSAFTSGPPEYTRSEVARMAILTATIDIFGEPAKFVDTLRPGAIASVSAVIEGSNGPDLGDIHVGNVPDTQWRTAAVAAIRERLAEFGRA